MEFFLTSQANEVLSDIVKRLSKQPAEYAVALVTTAAKPYPDPWWLLNDKAKLLELRFSVKEVDVDGKSYEELKNELAGVDIIFVAGGNTIYLWEKIKESGFDTLMREMMEAGTIYIGSSAGSVICGPTVEPSTFFDDRESGNLKDFTSLGLVDFVPVPHYRGTLDNGAVDAVLEKYKNFAFPLRPMTDSQYYHGKDGALELVDLKPHSKF